MIFRGNQSEEAINVKKGVVIGGASGFVVGLMAGPPGAIIGGAVGAGIGAVVAYLVS